ncbi:MAG: helix-turn-helix domain-containing protein [Verrucomicrobia bacterium]|nr:helix-turn-helix domain-containing protein [Verrucomicrobiota bacterium]
MTKQRKGSHLKRLRERAGLSARDLGERIGVRHSNILFWENSGTLPRSNILVSMAQALGVTVEELLGEARPRRVVQPGGKLGRVFQEVSKLPRRQQQKIVDVVEALVAQNKS